MIVPTLIVFSLVLAAIPAGLFFINLAFYRVPTAVRDRRGDTAPEAISVLIPARNEERNIRATLESILASRGADFEVVVLDDHSTDGTAALVGALAARDPRVRLEAAPPLPAGWCGKQHACQVLAGLATHPWLLFIDADVRLSPDALARLGASARRLNADLLSGVPRQETGTFLERLLLPLIHFILLGYLPMPLMRWTRSVGFSAGCGQLFLARASAYWKAGGHASIRSTLHDGVKLPRLFRRAGLVTDLVDATPVATCRMYTSNREVWAGLGKNAIEGLAAPGTIGPMTIFLLGGQVLPLIGLALAAQVAPSWIPAALVAVTLAYVPRWVAAWKFHQDWSSALLHPIGTLALLWIQWTALARWLGGKPSVWKGRSYGAFHSSATAPGVRPA